MGIFLLCLGLGIFIFSQFYAIKYKQKMEDSELLYYEKNLRPQVIKHYYLNLLPFCGIVILFLSQNYNIFNDNAIVIYAIIILCDIGTLFVINRKMIHSEGINFSKIFYVFTSMIIGKTIAVISFYFIFTEIFEVR
jgi:hypothetical protein